MDFICNMVYARTCVYARVYVYARTDANEKHNGCVCYRTHQRAKKYIST